MTTEHTYPGPCCICGGTNYALSCGGPTICPKCDAGQFDAATVMQQAKALKQFRKLADEAYAKGFAEGLEKAAEVVESMKDETHWPKNKPHHVAAAIRKLAVDHSLTR